MNSSTIGTELQTLAPEIFNLIQARDGVATLLVELPKKILPAAAAPDGLKRRSWELAGLYYLEMGRCHEALAIFWALYQHMLVFQGATGGRTHKGVPLVWMSECYRRLGFRVHAKRPSLSISFRTDSGRLGNCPRFRAGARPSASAATIVSPCTSSPRYRVLSCMTDSSFVALRLGLFAEIE
jgi:hypothetical protein